MNRYTFVVQVHPDGVSTLENLSTSQRVPIADMGAVGEQIERWLAELRPATREPASTETRPGP